MTSLLDPKLLDRELGKFLRIALASLVNLDDLFAISCVIGSLRSTRLSYAGYAHRRRSTPLSLPAPSEGF